jgi:hypothetical protein
MQCSVHRGKIRGRIHYWNHQPMCGSCYGRFTSKVRLLRQPRVRPAARNSGFLGKLRSLLGW